MRFICFLLLSLLLSACATSNGKPGNSYESYLTYKNLPAPTLESFPHCRAYGCQSRDQLSLSTEDWQEISNLFKPVENAESERTALIPAIALFEKKIGALNGTSADKGGTFSGIGQVLPTQHDCVDESINTTIYLALLYQKGLLSHHDVNAPISRTPFTTLASGKLWPHQSAVITDKTTGTRYAVDSWFHDNGEPIEIVPLKSWIHGWSPEKTHE